MNREDLKNKSDSADAVNRPNESIESQAPRPPAPRGSGGTTVALLQGIKSGQIDPSAIGRDDRRLLVSHLMADGYSTAEIAQILKVSDRSIARDKRVIREDYALTQDPKLAEQMTGRLVTEAELVVQRIRRIVRDKTVKQAVRIDGEHRCYLVISDLVQRLQGLGYLPTASQRIEADLVHHAGDLPDLDELTVEVQRIRQLSVEGGRDVPTEIVELEGQIANVKLVTEFEAHAQHDVQSAPHEGGSNDNL